LPFDSNIAVVAFTCNAVINPILWLNLSPNYIDLDKTTLSMSLTDLKSKVNSKTKVIILQHTFGMQANEEIIQFVKEKGIYVLEDCAHCLGNTELGIKGDASILSFGIEKLLSTRVGGAVIINNEKLKTNFEKEFSKLKNMSLFQTKKWLFNPLIWRILRATKGMQMFLAKIINRVGFLDMGFQKGELVGIKPKIYPTKLSSPLCEFVCDELADINNNLLHRKQISKVYSEQLQEKINDIAYVRYPYVCKDLKQAEKISKSLILKGYPIGNWYNPVVYPSVTNLSAMKYVNGSCMTAQDISMRIINLPTGKNISDGDAKNIASIIKLNS
jgi:perosamine synthetase